MKIVGLIDNLGSGGAQRQLIMVMSGLKQKGFDVVIMVYNSSQFYKELLVKFDIKVLHIKSNRLTRFIYIWKAIRNFEPDFVISYLNMPNIYSELASFLPHKWKLIVSERRGKIGRISFWDKLRLHLHRRADYVVANGFSLTNWITSNAPWLIPKTKTIINTVDLNYFQYNLSNIRLNEEKTFAIIVIASFQYLKNPFNLIRAVKILKNKNINISLSWYGNRLLESSKKGNKINVYSETQKLVIKLGLEREVKLYDEIKDVRKKYSEADLICLPSFYEGFPNVICEAMACGKPIIASNVCDIPYLIEDNVNGYLFDPYFPEDISSAILKVKRLNRDAIDEMGKKNRKKSELLFDKELFINKYISLIN